MTPQQEAFWQHLKFDPHWVAHHWGQTLREQSEQEVNARIQPVIEELLANAEVEVVCRVLKTWLSTYKLALNPQTLGVTFDRVHDRIGARVRQDATNIEVL